MEISLNKEQLEEILISLFFTGFIKERHELPNKSTEIVKYLIKKLEGSELNELLEYNRGKPYLSEKLNKETMLLVCLNDGNPVEDIDATFKDTMEHLTQLVKEGKLIIPE